MTLQRSRNRSPAPTRANGQESNDTARVFRYAVAVLGALRIHFFALPAAAVLAGAASSRASTTTAPVVVAAIAAGLGWGGGQLLNDLLDVTADAIDAPDRAGPRGLLRPRPTLALAFALGLIVTLATLSVHGEAAWLAAAGWVLLLVYGPCKRYPAVGNVAHGALYAVATLIGAAASMPDLPLGAVLSASWSVALLSGAWATLYVQSNYEKDRRGDRMGGNLTLAHVLGLRVSAWGRVVAALAWGAAALVLAPGVCRPLLGLAVGLVGVSASFTISGNTESAALRGYRYAVHGAMMGLWALASPALSSATLTTLITVAAALVEIAFRRNANP